MARSVKTKTLLQRGADWRCIARLPRRQVDQLTLRLAATGRQVYIAAEFSKHLQDLLRQLTDYVEHSRPNNRMAHSVSESLLRIETQLDTMKLLRDAVEDGIQPSVGNASLDIAFRDLRRQISSGIGGPFPFTDADLRIKRNGAEHSLADVITQLGDSMQAFVSNDWLSAAFRSRAAVDALHEDISLATCHPCDAAQLLTRHDDRATYVALVDKMWRDIDGPEDNADTLKKRTFFDPRDRLWHAALAELPAGRRQLLHKTGVDVLLIDAGVLINNINRFSTASQCPSRPVLATGAAEFLSRAALAGVNVGILTSMNTDELGTTLQRAGVVAKDLRAVAPRPREAIAALDKGRRFVVILDSTATEEVASLDDTRHFVEVIVTDPRPLQPAKPDPDVHYVRTLDAIGIGGGTFGTPPVGPSARQPVEVFSIDFASAYNMYPAGIDPAARIQRETVGLG
jgi:hypothetical protein